jgi:Protein of unknown function (DUF2958)
MLAGLDGDVFTRALGRLILQGESIAGDRMQVDDVNYSIKLFLPDSHAKWILAYVEPNDTGLAWGLGDLGHDIVEFGVIPLAELRELSGPLGCRVQIDLFYERDRNFKEVWEMCRVNGRIIL